MKRVIPNDNTQILLCLKPWPELFLQISSAAVMKYVLADIAGTRGGLMVSALVSRSRGPCSSPGQVICVVFLGKTLLLQCLSPPRMQRTARELERDEMLGGGGEGAT